MSMPDNRGPHNLVNRSCVDCKWVVFGSNKFVRVLYEAHNKVKNNHPTSKSDTQVNRLFKYSDRVSPAGYRENSYGCLLNNNSYLPVIEESLDFPSRDSICFDKANSCEYYIVGNHSHHVWPFNSSSLYRWLTADNVKTEVIYFLLFRVLDPEFYDKLFYLSGTELEEQSWNYYIYFDLIGPDYSWWERKLSSIQEAQKFQEN